MELVISSMSQGVRLRDNPPDYSGEGMNRLDSVCAILCASLPNRSQRDRNIHEFYRELLWSPQTTLKAVMAMAAKHHVNFSTAVGIIQDLNHNGWKGWWLEVVFPGNMATIYDLNTKLCFKKIDKSLVVTEVPIERNGWQPSLTSHMEWARLKAVMDAFKGDRMMLALGGDPSIGKTYIAQHYALEGRECYNVTLNEDTFAGELKGYPVRTKDGMEWFDGPALRAYRNGGRIVINEIQRAATNTLSFLLELTDSSNSSCISLPPPSYETVKPHPKFQVIASYNGDFDDMPEALKSRFAKNVHLKSANPEAIRVLPAELQAIAARTVILEDVERRISLRHWFDFVELKNKGLDEETAAWAIFGDSAQEILNQIKFAS